MCDHWLCKGIAKKMQFLPLGHFDRRGIVVTSVCPSVRLCVEIFVRAITCLVFELGSPNLQRMCILGPFRTLLKTVLIDLDLQGHLGLKRSKSAKNGFVRAITRHVFELGSPNLHQMCILGPFRTLLKMVLIDLYLQGHLGLNNLNLPKMGLSTQ